MNGIRDTTRRMPLNHTDAVRRWVPVANFRPLGHMLLGLVCALGPLAAHSSGIDELGQLMRAGQYRDAFSKIEAVLGERPRDPQMLYMKSMILAEQNMRPEAIGILISLTEEHPTLVEPYNSLALLYSADGQYDKALAALNSAIRINPANSATYKNLGDLHVNIAVDAYRKASRFNAGDSNPARTKMAVLQSDSTGLKSAAIVRTSEKTPTETPEADRSVVMRAQSGTGINEAVLRKYDMRSVSNAGADKPGTAEQDRNIDRIQILQLPGSLDKVSDAMDMKACLGHVDDFRPPQGKSVPGWRQGRVALKQWKDPVFCSRGEVG
jgi:tetratricopeptide (TPR) repeat protein